MIRPIGFFAFNPDWPQIHITSLRSVRIMADEIPATQPTSPSYSPLVDPPTAPAAISVATAPSATPAVTTLKRRYVEFDAAAYERVLEKFKKVEEAVAELGAELRVSNAKKTLLDFFNDPKKQ